MVSLILLLPLLSSFFSGFWGYKLGTKGVACITVGSLVLSGVISIVIFCTVGLQLSPIYVLLGNWVSVEGLQINWVLFIDNPSLLMFVLVTIVSSLVYIYTLVYMLGDPHLIRFSCYITLFTFFMLVLVSSDNLVQLFLGWEGVGLVSYLLINFWFTRIPANKAAIQAMMVNKVGDMALLLGISVSFLVFGSADFSIMFMLTPFLLKSTCAMGSYTLSSITLFTWLIFVGAVGKSAQIGLHTWLPSAMEGPTPVSALIHAATMVTAGVFLIIRCSTVFEYADSVLVVITLTGALTAFFSATIGIFQNDLKRIIAYSTCSQLGYMVFACGLSSYPEALFHLVNHGFFKALLFLSAGSIIHGFSDEQDIRKMGGLGRLFPVTYVMFLVGSLSLMGFPFLSGFFSKDLILEAAFASYTISGTFSYWFGTLSAFFTAFYSFRLVYLTFLSPSNSHKVVVQAAHESSGLTIFSLGSLSLGSLFSGFFLKELFVGVGSIFLGNSILVLPSHFVIFEAEFLPTFIKLIPLILSLSGAGFSLLLMGSYGSVLSLLKVTQLGTNLYSFFNQKWFIDGAYQLVLLKPLFHWSYLVPFRSLDKGFIELFGPLGISNSFRCLSKQISLFQTGFIYHYTFLVILGVFCYLYFSLFWNSLKDYASLEVILYLLPALGILLFN